MQGCYTPDYKLHPLLVNSHKAQNTFDSLLSHSCIPSSYRVGRILRFLVTLASKILHKGSRPCRRSSLNCCTLDCTRRLLKGRSGTCCCINNPLRHSCKEVGHTLSRILHCLVYKVDKNGRTLCSLGSHNCTQKYNRPHHTLN